MCPSLVNPEQFRIEPDGGSTASSSGFVVLGGVIRFKAAENLKIGRFAEGGPFVGESVVVTDIMAGYV